MRLNFRVELTPRDIKSHLTKFQTNIPRRELDTFMRRIAKETEITMKKKVPVRSGKLRNSIKTITRDTKSGQVDLRSKIQVGTRLPYARYIDQGTKSSPGRYVPFLGRRLVVNRPGFGLHPGVRGRNFLRDTKREMDGKSRDMINDFVKSWGEKLRR
jgi:hypothetical protein